jgi:hypothetical protein
MSASITGAAALAAPSPTATATPPQRVTASKTEPRDG